MTIMEAMKERHSVRQYSDKPIETEKIAALEKLITKYNREGDLHIQLVTNEPKAFSGAMAHYGKFSGVTNYLAMIGRKGSDLDEKIGYYGEKIVLEAQAMGLNTCWVALTFSKIKGAFEIAGNEKLVVVIPIGYGIYQGIAHKTKPIPALCNVQGEIPDWFRRGIQCVQLAPTAMNQQKFTFALDGTKVTAKAGLGFYTKVDLGIAKYHFEIGAEKDRFSWSEV